MQKYRHSVYTFTYIRMYTLAKLLQTVLCGLYMCVTVRYSMLNCWQCIGMCIASYIATTLNSQSLTTGGVQRKERSR